MVTSPLRTMFPLEEPANIGAGLPNDFLPKGLSKRLAEDSPDISSIRTNPALDIIRQDNQKDSEGLERTKMGRLYRAKNEEILVLPSLSERWMGFIRQLSESLQRDSSAKDCMLFFGREGVVDLAAVGTEAGHEICIFKDTDLEVVVGREKSEGLANIISRCHCILQTVSEDFLGIDRNSLYRSSLTANVDIRGLQLLTRLL